MPLSLFLKEAMLIERLQSDIHMFRLFISILKGKKIINSLIFPQEIIAYYLQINSATKTEIM